jgi:hypothetical protein
MSANAEPNVEPPVIIVGGSITIDLRERDFPNQPQPVNGKLRINNGNLRITGMILEIGSGEPQTIQFPNGKFKITLIRG